MLDTNEHADMEDACPTLYKKQENSEQVNGDNVSSNTHSDELQDETFNKAVKEIKQLSLSLPANVQSLKPNEVNSLRQQKEIPRKWSLHHHDSSASGASSPTYWDVEHKGKFYVGTTHHYRRRRHRRSFNTQNSTTGTCSSTSASDVEADRTRRSDPFPIAANFKSTSYGTPYLNRFPSKSSDELKRPNDERNGWKCDEIGLMSEGETSNSYHQQCHNALQQNDLQQSESRYTAQNADTMPKHFEPSPQKDNLEIFSKKSDRPSSETRETQPGMHDFIASSTTSRPDSTKNNLVSAEKHNSNRASVVSDKSKGFNSAPLKQEPTFDSKDSLRSLTAVYASSTNYSTCSGGTWMTTACEHGDTSPADSDPSNTSPTSDLDNRRSKRSLSSDKTLYPLSMTLLPIFEGNFIEALVLGVWDNILGPTVVHCWHSAVQQHDNDVIRFVANHVLGGEVCRDTNTTNVSTKFYIMQDKNMLLFAFLFSASTKFSVNVHSLSLVIPYKFLDRICALHDTVVAWVTRHVHKLRVLLRVKVKQEAIRHFSRYLPQLLEVVSSLQTDGLPERISIEDTLLAGEMMSFDAQLLRKSIASHLQTFGSTVVIGRSGKLINKMINTLSLFMWRREEKRCCRHVHSNQTYHPDILLQGLLQGANGELNISSKEVLCSRFPTTMVDISSGKVRQTFPFPEHISHRHQLLVHDLQCLWNDEDEQSVYPTGNLFRSSDCPESLVKTLLDELAMMPEGDSREVHIDNFHKRLEMKAFSLFRLTSPRTKFIGKSSAAPKALKKLRQELDLEKDGDFRIVMAVAEKMWPGVYQVLCGGGMHGPRPGRESSTALRPATPLSTYDQFYCHNTETV